VVCLGGCSREGSPPPPSIPNPNNTHAHELGEKLPGFYDYQDFTVVVVLLDGRQPVADVLVGQEGEGLDGHHVTDGQLGSHCFHSQGFLSGKGEGPRASNLPP
jgi:hypothetical protein